VDWEYDEGAHAFDDPNSLLAERAASALDFRKHVENSFKVLVTVLQEVRRRHLVDADVVLIVTSTDPGPRLEELAEGAVRLLNPPELFAEWRAAS